MQRLQKANTKYFSPLIFSWFGLMFQNKEATAKTVLAEVLLEILFCCTTSTPKKHGQTQIQRCIIGNTVCRTLPDSLPVVPHNGESAALREQYFRYYLLPHLHINLNIELHIHTTHISTSQYQVKYIVTDS